jgi:hypothetical protein
MIKARKRRNPMENGCVRAYCIFLTSKESVLWQFEHLVATISKPFRMSKLVIEYLRCLAWLQTS